MPKLFGLGQVGQGHCFQHLDALIKRVPEIPHSGIRHQRFLAATQEFIEQRQIRPVVQHVGHQNQIKPIRLGKKSVE